MKSNKLNIVASLLLITAGISAVNQEDLKKVYAVLRNDGTMTASEAQKVNLGNLGNLMNLRNISTDTSSIDKAILVLANNEATFALRNIERVRRNIIAPIVRNRYTIAKAAAVIGGTIATAYVVDRYANEGKGLKYTQDAASKGLAKVQELKSSAYAKGQEYSAKMISNLPAKPSWLRLPSWFGIPTGVSKFFGEKTEAKQPEQANTPAATPAPVETPAATPAPVETPAATPAPVETPAATPAPVETPAPVIDAGV